MPLDLEDAIVEGLASAGDALPSPVTDLAARAKRRHRSRRRNRGLVSVVVLALVAGAVYTDQGHRHATPTGPAHFELTGLPLVTDTWPQAIRTLPETLPNGNKYAVIAQIDAGTYLVQASLANPSSGAVYEFEPAGNTLHELIAGPGERASAPLQAAQMVDDNRYVAVATNITAGEATDVYVASVADRRQIAHIVVPGSDPVPIDFGWYDGQIAWSAVQTGYGFDPYFGMYHGIYGPADLTTPIAGTARYAIDLPTNPWAASSTQTGAKYAVDMWNLQTGQHQRATVSDDEQHFYYCLPSACRLSTAEPHSGEVLTINGIESDIGTAKVSGHFLVQTALTDAPIGPAITTIWDMVDNTYVALPVIHDTSLRLLHQPQSQSQSIVTLSDDDNHKVILNLAAIKD